MQIKWGRLATPPSRCPNTNDNYTSRASNNKNTPKQLQWALVSFTKWFGRESTRQKTFMRFSPLYLLMRHPISDFLFLYTFRTRHCCVAVHLSRIDKTNDRVKGVDVVPSHLPWNPMQTQPSHLSLSLWLFLLILSTCHRLRNPRSRQFSNWF